MLTDLKAAVASPSVAVTESMEVPVSAVLLISVVQWEQVQNHSQLSWTQTDRGV